jgi:hypothetical protein
MNSLASESSKVCPYDFKKGAVTRMIAIKIRRFIIKSRFIGIKLCKPIERYNITILCGEEEWSGGFWAGFIS